MYFEGFFLCVNTYMYSTLDIHYNLIFVCEKYTASILDRPTSILALHIQHAAGKSSAEQGVLVKRVPKALVDNNSQ